MIEYRNFITRNEAYLNTCLKTASKDKAMILGLDYSSAKDAFDALMNKEDLYLLPYCLYLIQFGIGVNEDKPFSMKAFSELLPNSRSLTAMPVLAYVYAYCHNRDGDLEISQAIIEHLVSVDFAPAMATMGDLHWHYGEFADAKEYYKQSAAKDHFIGRVCLHNLFKNEVSSFAHIKFSILSILKGLFGSSRGEKFLYLSFYGKLKGRAQ